MSLPGGGHAGGMDAQQWNDRYATSEFVWTTTANQFLPPEVEGLTAGKALDLACGEGRNAVWLATQGWEATGVDFSSSGLAKAAALAEASGVAGTTRWVCADATSWDPDDAFDLVVVFYLQLPAAQRRSAMAVAAGALAPAGTLVVVGHDLTNLTDGVGGPPDPAVLYTPDDVVADLLASGVDGLEIEQATRVLRPVASPAAAPVAAASPVASPAATPVADSTTGASDERHAIDCLVRAKRA